MSVARTSQERREHVLRIAMPILVMSARPGRISSELAIEASYPRDQNFRTSAEYAAYCRRASTALAQAMADNKAAGDLA